MVENTIPQLKPNPEQTPKTNTKARSERVLIVYSHQVNAKAKEASRLDEYFCYLLHHSARDVFYICLACAMTSSSKIYWPIWSFFLKSRCIIEHVLVYTLVTIMIYVFRISIHWSTSVEECRCSRVRRKLSTC